MSGFVPSLYLASLRSERDVLAVFCRCGGCFAKLNSTVITMSGTTPIVNCFANSNFMNYHDELPQTIPIC